MAKCTPPTRGDLSLTRLPADLYRPASIFQTTSILISPSINVLSEEKFHRVWKKHEIFQVHPWKLELSVSELTFKRLYIYMQICHSSRSRDIYITCMHALWNVLTLVTEMNLPLFLSFSSLSSTEEMASFPRANIKEPSIVKHHAKVQETTPAAMEGQTKGGREKRDPPPPPASSLRPDSRSGEHKTRRAHFPPPRINT